MLHKLLILCFSLCLTSLMAQDVPQAFKYQSVIRDAAGNTMTNQAVGIQFQLAQTVGADLVVVYTETHAATTSNIGLINLSVGKGTATLGNFSQTDWSKPTFLNIAVDITGDTNYLDLGAAELLSVPYALYAANGGGSDADADPANELQTLTQTRANVTLSNGGGTISINDADANATNEIELPTDAVAGDIAYYNGTAWKRVPEGKGGQTLTLRNNGNPAWTGISTEDLYEVILPNGEIMNVSPTIVDNVDWAGFNPVNSGPNFPTQAQAILDFNGEANTQAIVAEVGDNGGTPYAAKICADMVAFGFDDWYLPAQGEMKVMVEQIGSTAIGGNGQVPFGVSWSSTKSSTVQAWYIAFDNLTMESLLIFLPSSLSCRCARK